MTCVRCKKATYDFGLRSSCSENYIVFLIKLSTWFWSKFPVFLKTVLGTSLTQSKLLMTSEILNSCTYEYFMCLQQNEKSVLLTKKCVSHLPANILPTCFLEAPLFRCISCPVFCYSLQLFISFKYHHITVSYKYLILAFPSHSFLGSKIVITKGIDFNEADVPYGGDWISPSCAVEQEVRLL